MTKSVGSASISEALIRGNTATGTNGSLNRATPCGATNTLVAKRQTLGRGYFVVVSSKGALRFSLYCAVRKLKLQQPISVNIFVLISRVGRWRKTPLKDMKCY